MIMLKKLFKILQRRKNSILNHICQNASDIHFLHCSDFKGELCLTPENVKLRFDNLYVNHGCMVVLSSIFENIEDFLISVE